MSSQKSQLQDIAAQAVLAVDPTEQPRLTLLAIDGPSQFLVGMLGPIGLLLIKSYFITLTERSVFVHRGPRLKNRPEELVHTIPLDQAVGLVDRVKRGRNWSALYLNFPGGSKPTRLNVSRHSHAELDQFLAAFAEGAKSKSL